MVTSSAVRADNPEVAAKRAGAHIPVIQRAEMLAELMRLKYGIAWPACTARRRRRP